MFLLDATRVKNLRQLGAHAGADNEAEKGEQRTESGKPGLSKGNWIRKLGNYSPTACRVAARPTKTGAIRVLNRSGLCDTYEATTPRRTSSETALEMPDLETIIREFEMGYRSPTKQDTSMEKNFVKKIVAAFEVKYKVFDDLKTAQEAIESQDTSNPDSTEAVQRRSGIFSNPFKSGTDEFKRLGKSGDSKQNRGDKNRKSGIFPTLSKNNLEDSNYSRRPGIFSTPRKTPSAEDKDQVDCSRTVEEGAKKEDRSFGIYFTPTKEKLEDSKGSRRSGIFSSPCSGSKDSNTSKSDIYMSPVDPNRTDSKNASPDSACIFKFDKEEPSEKLSCHFSPLKASSLDETRTMDSIDLSATLPEPEETIFFSGSNLPTTSTMINEIREEEGNSDAAAGSRFDRTPKIVGAFLKKPIEVEDTSIDWIPITGKKLPRKRSLKQLLSSLTGKKSLDKKSKMFSSQRNLYEEPRELQDSGYDEKSCSSSSLTSLVSITETLLLQENSYVEPERRSTLRTFRSHNSLNEEEDEAFYDAYATIKKRGPKKLLLTEVPRQEVKLDLGPCYPPPPLKKVTMSLDRKAAPKKPHCPSPVYVELDRVPKHPHLSKMRKHPFVSLTKMDEAMNPFDKVVIIKNDLYEVEFRRSSDDVTSPASSHSRFFTQSHYDVPRRFLSKSESEISQLCNGTTREQPSIYDVPRSCPIERPRSSVYEDALSLKRRSAIVAEPFFRFNAIMRVTEFHYDILTPRNCRMYRNEAVVRSDSDLLTMEKRSSV